MLVAQAAVVGHALICDGLHHSNSQSASSRQCCMLGPASRGSLTFLIYTGREELHDDAQAAAGFGQLFRVQQNLPFEWPSVRRLGTIQLLEIDTDLHSR